MSANLYQGSGQHTSSVGERMKTRLAGPIAALKQGSGGPVMSDLQVMQADERKQHQQAYIYEHGHNDHGMGQ